MFCNKLKFLICDFIHLIKSRTVSNVIFMDICCMSLSLSIAFLNSNAENLIETKQLFFFPKDLIKLMCTGKPSIQISHNQVKFQNQVAFLKDSTSFQAPSIRELLYVMYVKLLSKLSMNYLMTIQCNDIHTLMMSQNIVTRCR